MKYKFIEVLNLIINGIPSIPSNGIPNIYNYNLEF